MNSQDWIGTVITAARPQVMAALLRNFRDFDAAEEAFQEACLRALKSWTQNGPPRNSAAWLIMVARNAAIDTVRKQSQLRPLPPEEMISDLSDTEAAEAQRLDEADYRDDILRLLFVCCHPDLPSTQQIALALRIVSGLTVSQIARAFLVSEAAMEQRITRAKSKIAGAHVPFEVPGAIERSERLAAVAAMIYLVFNEGYTTNVAEHGAKAPLCEEAIRLCRLLLRLFPTEPEIMGLAALVLLQHARSAARFDANGAVVLLEDQDRTKWDSAHDCGGSRSRRQGSPPSSARALSGAGGHRCTTCPRAHVRRNRLGANRSALRHARTDAAFARRNPQSCRGRIQVSWSFGRAGHDRAIGREAKQLLLFPRGPRRLPEGTWAGRRGPSGLRSRHCARHYASRGRTYPQPDRPLGRPPADQ